MNKETLDAIRRIYQYIGWESDWDVIVDLVKCSGNPVIPLLDHINHLTAECQKLRALLHAIGWDDDHIDQELMDT